MLEANKCEELGMPIGEKEELRKGSAQFIFWLLTPSELQETAHQYRIVSRRTDSTYRHTVGQVCAN
jgi:hypothetical protein